MLCRKLISFSVTDLKGVRGLIKNNVFVYTVTGISVIGIVLCQWVIKFSDDAVLDGLIRQTASEGFLALLVTMSFIAVNGRFFGERIGFLRTIWVVPCLLVAVANFPFFALITGKAQILYPQYIWLLVLRCALVGFCEEVFFRGTVLSLLSGRLKGRGRLLKAVVISSAVFALWHLFNLFGGGDVWATLLQVGYTFLIGCMLAILALKTKTVVFGAVIHGAFNVGGQIVTDLGKGVFQDGVFWTCTAVAAVVATVFSVIMLLSVIRHKEAN